VVDGWFSPCTPVSSTNKTDRFDINEILLKVALNTIAPNLNLNSVIYKQKWESPSKLFRGNWQKRSSLQGRTQDYKLGDGRTQTKLRRAEGGAKIFGVIRAPPPTGSAPPLYILVYFIVSDSYKWLLFHFANTVKHVNKGHSREPENVACMSSCFLYTGWNYMHYSLMGISDCPL
jgi:hypothetical protein